ncbi:MAG: GNAT family N-acetyltransferase [Acidobacteriota bacterium]
MIIRDIVSIGEMHRAEELQREVWEIEDRDILPALWLKASISIGHTLVGAFDGSELAGFAYAAIGVLHEEIIHHSDMLAVREKYRRSGLGVALKLAQRERALTARVRRITWTFDPLRAGNASLNLTRLGAVGETYLVDYYGETTSALHRGIGTDRLWMSWILEDQSVMDRIEGHSACEVRGLFDSASAVIEIDSKGEARFRPASITTGDLSIRVPTDIGAIMTDDPPRARRWREETRRAFVAAFAMGYRATDFRLHQGHGEYLLRHL